MFATENLCLHLLIYKKRFAGEKTKQLTEFFSLSKRGKIQLENNLITRTTSKWYSTLCFSIGIALNKCIFLNTTPVMNQKAETMYIWKAVQVILKCRLPPLSGIGNSGIKINPMCVHCTPCQTSGALKDPASKSVLRVSLAVNRNVPVAIPCVKDSGMKDSIRDSEVEYKSLTDFGFIDAQSSVDFQKQSAKCWLKALGLSG